MKNDLRRVVLTLPLAILVCLSTAGACVAQEPIASQPYPLGLVIDPGGGQIPSRQQQQHHYQWAADLGFNILEHEMLPVADGYLSWGGVQVGPEEFDWASYDGVVEDAEEAGLDLMLELHTWTWLPDWLVDKYPDMLMQTPLGGSDTLTTVKREPGGEDINTMPSFADERFVEAAVAYTRQVVRRYADRDRVRGYIIAEERGLAGIWPAGNYYGIDFSPPMRDRYHQHLRDKFKTIDALNTAWGHPGRYNDFDEINWQRGWAHEPADFRGEWLEYYRLVQHLFADYHNRIARAVHEEDPGAIVMLSDWAAIVNRVGHGTYLPLFTEIDAIGFKSFWNDPRMQMDYCHTASGGKDVWITNFSEAQTTRGENLRYLESPFVRQAFWASYARGCRGVFLFVWTPSQPQKMSLLEPQPDGSLEPIPAIDTTIQIVDFLKLWQPIFEAYQPAPPRVALHDPNLTFIADFWNRADPTPLRAHWHTQATPTQLYHKAFDELAALNRRFTISTDEALDQTLADASIQVLMLTGCNYLDDATLAHITEWIEQGRPTIVDESTGRFDPLGQQRDALEKYHKLSHVLTLRGERWDRDKKQVRRIGQFLDRHAPLPYRERGGANSKHFTLDLLRTPSGQEMAIVIRRETTSPPRPLQIDIDWHSPFEQQLVLDPFAETPSTPDTAKWQERVDDTVIMPADRDVLIVLTR